MYSNIENYYAINVKDFLNQSFWKCVKLKCNLGPSQVHIPVKTILISQTFLLGLYNPFVYIVLFARNRIILYMLFYKRKLFFFNTLVKVQSSFDIYSLCIKFPWQNIQQAQSICKKSHQISQLSSVKISVFLFLILLLNPWTRCEINPQHIKRQYKKHYFGFLILYFVCAKMTIIIAFIHSRNIY